MTSPYPLINIHAELDGLCDWLEAAVEPGAPPETVDEAIEAAQPWLGKLEELLREFAYPAAEHRVEVDRTQANEGDDEFAGVNASYDPGPPHEPGLALWREFDRLAAPFRCHYPATRLNAPLPTDAAGRVAELNTLVETRLGPELETQRREYDEDEARWGDGPNAY